jgi:HK97 family phage major capsid protein
MSRKRLAQLQSRYTEHQAALTAVLDKAADENRAQLTPDEETLVRASTEALDTIVPELEALAGSEARNARMADLVAGVQGDEAPEGENGDGTNERGRYTTQDRDPGHYRSAKDGGRHSFFHDLVHARPEVSDDSEARTRLTEHTRALTTGVAGAGIVPPKWLTDQYAPLARQGRVVANAVRHIDLGDDPRPVTLPKQTTGTDNVVAEQSTENTHPTETDAFATDSDTVTFKPTSGIQVVSRQTIDMTDPSIDELIYGDLISVYDGKVEDKVVAAMLAAATAATTVTTFATDSSAASPDTGDWADIDPVPVALDAMIDAEFAVWGARYEPADATIMRIPRWGKFRKLRDLDGRALIPPEFQRQQMVNVEGVGTVAARGQVEDLAVLPTKSMGTTAYPESILVARLADTILWEGALQRFRFEEVAGPESIKLGIWAYTGCLVRYASSSVRRIVITAA